jgi:hypothetical protein
VLIALLLATAAPLAAPPPAAEIDAPAPIAEDAAAYCRYLQAVAASQGDLLFSPTLFATLGAVDVSDVSTTGVPEVSHALRVTAGAGYSGQRLALGLLGRRQAEAECALYRAGSRLRALLFAGEQVFARPALAARAALLAARLPRAAELLEEERREVAAGNATAEQLTVTQLRVEALRALATQTQQALASLAGEESPPRLTALLREREAAERRLVELEGAGRELRAFDVTLRLGVDRQLLQPTDLSPFFGLVSVSFNPGLLFQSHHEAEAREAHAAWVPREAGGVGGRAEQLLVRLRATLSAESARLAEQRLLARDLAERTGTLAGLAGDKARRFRDYLWLEATRVEAEEAYLAAHVAALQAALGEENK